MSGVTTSGIPPTRVATVGSPIAIARSSPVGSAAARAVCTNRSAAASNSVGSRWRWVNRTRSANASVAATRDSSQGRSGPSPASASTSGRSSGQRLDGVEQQLVALVAAHRSGAKARPRRRSSTSSTARRRARRASSGTPGSTTPLGTSRTSVSGPARLRYHSRCTCEIAIVRVMNRCRARILALRLSRSTRSAGSLWMRCRVETAGMRLRAAAAAPTTSACGRCVCTISTRCSRSSLAVRATARGSQGNRSSSATGTPARRSALIFGDVRRDRQPDDDHLDVGLPGGPGEVDEPDLGAVGVQGGDQMSDLHRKLCSSLGRQTARSQVVTAPTLSGDGMRPSAVRCHRWCQAVTAVVQVRQDGGMDGPVVLVDAESDVERGLVAEWLRTHDVHPRELLPIDAKRAGPSARASLADDVPVTPVRVAWLPRERGGQPAGALVGRGVAGRRMRARPPAGVQARIVRREPDRATVVAGEPATVGDLRRRYGRPTSGAHVGFAAFVARQATLALERAERGLLGDHYKVPRLIAEAIEDSPEYRREVAELAARLELPEAEVARRAAADLAGLVASMSPMAVDLLTGATAAPALAGVERRRSTRPGWRGCGSATAPIRWCSCPATAATPIRCCSPTCSPTTTSPATTCSAGTT